MYQIGDLVVYGGSGVCRISAVGTRGTDGADADKCYYTLSPLYGTETIYVPVDTRVPMRPALTRTEAERFICALPEVEALAIDAQNLHLAARQYQAAFRPCDCTALAQLIKAAYSKDAAARRAGKKPGKVDEKYRKRAEEILHGELAAALGIPRERVPQEIAHLLEGRTPID